MLYDRIIGRDDSGNVVPERIAPEILTAVMSEFARDAITGAQAREMMAALGCPIYGNGEVAEVTTLLQTITSQPTAAAKLARNQEIGSVLFLARLQTPGYSRPYEVKARLGV